MIGGKTPITYEDLGAGIAKLLLGACVLFSLFCVSQYLVEGSVHIAFSSQGQDSDEPIEQSSNWSDGAEFHCNDNEVVTVNVGTTTSSASSSGYVGDTSSELNCYKQNGEEEDFSDQHI